MINCKLTTEKFTTFGSCQWGEKVTHYTSGKGNLCTSGWLHYYRHPLLAVLHNRIHASYPNPVLWLCKVAGHTRHDGLMKSGCSRLTTLTQIPLPEITDEQFVEYAIRCTLYQHTVPKFIEWANLWLDGDRTLEHVLAYTTQFSCPSLGGLTLFPGETCAWDAAHSLCMKKHPHYRFEAIHNLRYATGLAASKSHKALHMGGLDWYITPSLITIAKECVPNYKEPDYES